MSGENQSFVIEQLQALQQKPAPFSPGKPRFWDDPHISKQMLLAHLDPNTSAASRPPETIAHSVRWLVDVLELHPGDRVLDLGCGPGLYTARLAERGLQVTGLDYSRRSIDYAIQHARQNNLNITYRYQDYLTLTDEALYDAVLLISGDFCPLPPEQRARLLKNVHRALQAGGHFALDVTTREHRKFNSLGNRWYVAESGFWKAASHLVLEQGFDYPEELIYLNQYIVVEADGTISVYRNWFQDFTPERLTAELERGGFTVQSLWGDLTGRLYTEGAEWIGVVALKS